MQCNGNLYPWLFSYLFQQNEWVHSDEIRVGAGSYFYKGFYPYKLGAKSSVLNLLTNHDVKIDMLYIFVVTKTIAGQLILYLHLFRLPVGWSSRRGHHPARWKEFPPWWCPHLVPPKCLQQRLKMWLKSSWTKCPKCPNQLNPFLWNACLEEKGVFSSCFVPRRRNCAVLDKVVVKCSEHAQLISQLPCQSWHR